MKPSTILILVGIAFILVSGCTQTGKTSLEGMAKLPPIKACADTDSGLSYYAKGEVTDGENTYLDRCTAEGTLNEYYCDVNGKVALKNTACPQGTCFEGACK